MNVHFFGTAILVSLVLCAPMILASVVAIILRKRPLSWILYGAGTGVSAALLIAGNVFKDAFAKGEVGKELIQNVGEFTSLKELQADKGFLAVLEKFPNQLTAIKLYYYSSWSMTIALVLFLVFAIALFLVLIVLMNKKRENYVRDHLVSQYQMSFK